MTEKLLTGTLRLNTNKCHKIVLQSRGFISRQSIKKIFYSNVVQKKQNIVKNMVLDITLTFENQTIPTDLKGPKVKYNLNIAEDPPSKV